MTQIGRHKEEGPLAQSGQSDRTRLSAIGQQRTADSFSSLLVGKWQSPRHDYLFRADGTWTMLPAEEDGVQSTHGRIEGNQFFDTAATEPKRASTPLS
jgi:hypothetical protein